MWLTRLLLPKGSELPLVGVIQAEEAEDQLETRTANVSVYTINN